MCSFRIQIANNRWINVHNVYKASFNLYAFITTLLLLKTIQNQLNDDEKQIILKDFNLHHFLWSDLARFTQHDATNQFLKRRSSSSTSFHVFFKHNHVKNSSNVQYYWFDLYVRRIAKRIRALHVKIEIKSIVESYFNIYYDHTRDELENEMSSQSVKKD